MSPENPERAKMAINRPVRDCPVVATVISMSLARRNQPDDARVEFARLPLEIGLDEQAHVHLRTPEAQVLDQAWRDAVLVEDRRRFRFRNRRGTVDQFLVGALEL